MKTKADGIIKFFRYACLLCVFILGVITIIGSGQEDPWKPSRVYEDFYTSIAIDDLNGDGAPDIAVARVDSDTVAAPSLIVVILQDPLNPGSFKSPKRYPIGNYCWSIAIGDLNDDGLPDLASANERSNNVSILFQDSAEPGNFLSATNLPMASPKHVAIGDLNGDGLNDLVIAGENTAILLQDPDTPGTFLSATTLRFDADCVGIEDLNGDNLPDLAITETRTGTVAILLQDSINTGEFLPATYFGTGAHAHFVSIGYIDGDLLPDLAVVNYGSGSANDSVSVLLQDPGKPGSFRTATNYITGMTSDEVAIADVNGDNLSDLVVANSWGIVRNQNVGTISVLLQNPSSGGTFQDPTDYNMIFLPQSLAVGDLNGDNLPDIAVADDGAMLLFQKPGSPGIFSPPKRIGG